MSALTMTLKLAAVDVAGSIISRFKSNVLSIGKDAQRVKRDFDQMMDSFSKGAKALIISGEAAKAFKPAVNAAASMQEAMLLVKANLSESGKSAKEMAADLSNVRASAIALSKVAPFSAEDVVNIENTLVKAGLKMKDITGKGGAASAATQLATVTGEQPGAVAESLVRIATPFNIKGEGYGELADFLSRVDAASTTSVPELTQALKMSASTAATIGINFKDALTTLGALSPLGERAGSSFNNMLIGFTSNEKTARDTMRYLKLEFFKGGKFVGMEESINQMRKAFSKLDDQKKMIAAKNIFGEEGARAALALLKQGEGSFEAVAEGAQKAISLEEKMQIRLEGLNASFTALAGTAKSTLATIFDPMLVPLTNVTNMTNDLVAKIGEVAEKHETLRTGMLAGGVTAVGAGLAYGGYQLLKGGLAGKRVLQGVGGIKGLIAGLGSDAAGIAKGKAIEAASGVQSVYVTNWPADIGKGVDLKKSKEEFSSLFKKPALTSGGVVGSKGIFTKIGETAKKTLPAAATVGRFAATRALPVAGTAMTAYQAGSWLEKKFIGGAIGERLYDWMHPPAKTNTEKMKVRGVERGGSLASEPVVRGFSLSKGEPEGSHYLTPVFMQSPALLGHGRQVARAPASAGADIKQKITIMFDKDMNPRVLQEGPIKTEIGLNRGGW